MPGVLMSEANGQKFNQLSGARFSRPWALWTNHLTELQRHNIAMTLLAFM
jgi:hypothetical protein